MSEKYIPRLKALYSNEIVKNLEKELNIDNVNKLPRLERVIISCGVGKKREDKHFTETVALTLEKRSLAKLQLHVLQKNLSHLSRFVKAWVLQLAILLHYVMTKCTSSSIVSLVLLYHMSVTFMVYQLTHLTCRETIRSVLKNKPFSQKLPLKMHLFFMVSKLLLLSKMAPKKAVVSY